MTQTVERTDDAAAPAGSATVAARPGTGVPIEPPVGWTRSLHEALRLLGIIAVFINGAVVTTGMVSQPVLHNPVFLAGFLLLEAYQVLVLTALARRVHHWAVLPVLTVMLVSSHALMVAWRDELRPSDLWVPGMYAVSLQVLSLVTLPRRRHLAGFTTLLAALGVVEAVGFTQWQATPAQICDSVLVAEPLVTLEVFAAGLLAMARRHDASAAQATEVRARQAEQAIEDEGRREAARLMHDHVLHALHAVAEDRALVGAAQAVDECRTTMDLLERPAGATRLVSIGELVGDDPLLARLGAAVSGDTGPMPASIAGALAAAAHEALANVERHAGHGAACHVEVSTIGDGCRVRIVDDGRGFDVQRASRNRLGLQRSVRERMQGIGGRADITSAPGCGTTVDLYWPDPGEPTRVASDDPAWRSLDIRRLLALAALPGLATTIQVMALVAPRTRAALPGVVLTCLMTLIALVHVRRSGHRPMSRRAVAVLLGLAAAAWVAVLAGAPRHRMPNVYDLYVVWGIGAVAQIVMPNLPRRQAVATSWGVVAALLAGCLVRYPVRDVWHYLNGAVFAGVVVMVGYRVMWMAQDILAEARQQQDELDETHLELVRMHTLTRLDQFWSERTTQQALPLLRGIADGTLDATSDQVRHQARATEQIVRDELVLGPGQGAFSDQLHRLRQHGWVVRSSLSRDDGPDALAAAGRLVALLGPAAAPGQVLTLSAAADAVNAVVLDATSEQIAHFTSIMDTMGGTMHTDPDFIRLAVAAR